MNEGSTEFGHHFVGPLGGESVVKNRAVGVARHNAVLQITSPAASSDWGFADTGANLFLMPAFDL